MQQRFLARRKTRGLSPCGVEISACYMCLGYRVPSAAVRRTMAEAVSSPGVLRGSILRICWNCRTLSFKLHFEGFFISRLSCC
jgi:hypothetical protein